MAICAIIGHNELYDTNLDGKIVKAISSIARRHEEIDFWFHSTDRFSNKCFAAALHAKAQYPKKNVTLTVVAESIEEFADEDVVLLTGLRFPLCAFDRVLVPPYTDELIHSSDDMSSATIAHNRRIWKKIERWMLQQSDYCLCYVYRELLESKTGLYQYALRCKQLQMKDLTTPETTAYIRERASKLPERERDMFIMWDRGETLKTIAAKYGVTSTAVEQRLLHVRRKLRGLAAYRAEKMTCEEGWHKRCGIIGLTKSTERECVQLERTLAYLLRNQHINEIWIEEDVMYSSCYAAVKRQLDRYKGIKLFIVTQRTKDDETWKRLLWEKGPAVREIIHFNPECQSVRARKLRTIKHVIDNAGFCICNLAVDFPLRDSVIRCLRGRHPVAAIDIGHRAKLEQYKEDGGLG